MGSVAAHAAAASSSSGSSTFIIFIIIIIGAMYFLVMRPGRKRQQKAQQQQNNIQPGARVRTTAGMYATVVATDGDDVILEVAPDIEVRYMKRAIMEVIGDTGTAETEDGVGEDDETADYDETAEEHEEDLEHGDVTLEHDEHEEAAEHDEEVATPAGNYGLGEDDLTINGKPDTTKAQANGSHETITPEGTAAKE